MQTRTAISGLLLALATAGCLPARERITVAVKVLEGVACTELKVPRRWTVPPYDSSRLSVDLVSEFGFQLNEAGFEFRRSSRLLLGVVAPATLMPERTKSQLYSPDVYALTQPKGKASLERAPQNEWNVAQVLPQSRRHALRSIGILDDGKPLELDGHAFFPSGAKWVGNTYAATVLSADNAYLALISWDGTNYGGDILTRHDINGHYFVDLFHVPSGRKLALIQGTFHDLAPVQFASDSFWIEGPRFILPLAFNMRRLLMCEVQLK